MYLIWDNLATCSFMESGNLLHHQGWVIVDVRDFPDTCTDVEIIRRKIVTVATLLRLGEKVCVRCMCGINRSNAIALGAMCLAKSTAPLLLELLKKSPEGFSRTISKPKYIVELVWDANYKELKKRVGRANIMPQLADTVKRALVRTGLF